MKKNLLLRLCLMMVVVLSLFSCRQDLLHEQEAYHNTSAFQLKSNRIFLNDAKHKGKLVSEIKQTEDKLKTFSHTNAQGKVINYGNGVFIDTENVIYIENGPNYHTYTFNIIREGADENAPLENLVLSPLSDGTYREMLFSYHLTPNEKQILADGGFVNTEGKLSVIELGNNVFNPLASKVQTQNCHLEIDFHYTKCSENVHDHGEQYPACKATKLSELVYVITEVCTPNPNGSDDPNIPDYPNLPGGGGGGDDGGSSPDPCNGNGVLTGPQAPVSGIGYDSDGGCTGIPTQPNIPNPNNNPCEKTKAMLENPDVKKKLDSLEKKSTQGGEIGFKIKKDGTTSDIIHGQDMASEVALGDMTGWQGAYHNHTPLGIPMHSPPDIDNGLLKLARSQPTQPVGEHNNAYFGMIVKKACSTCTGGFKIYHYVIRFNGNYDDAITNFSQEKLDELKDTYRTLEKQLSETLPYVDFLGAADLNNKGVEKLFFETLTNMNIPHNVVTLQRVDDDSNGNVTVNNITLDTSGVPQAIPCP